MMEQNIPNNISNPWNKPVLDFIRDSSAHSDVAEVLLKAVKPLGDAQYFCPDQSKYRYVAVFTNNIIFGFAIGLNYVAFRLNTPFNKRAVETGGTPLQELSDEWISFNLFRDDWPETDLLFWARKAYVHARETTAV